jgi:hypothetical protein
MLRRIATFAVAATVGVSTLAMAGPALAAEPEPTQAPPLAIEHARVSPHSIVIERGERVWVKVSARITGAAKAAAWIHPARGPYGAEDAPAAKKDGPDSLHPDGNWFSRSFSLSQRDPDGRWYATIKAWDKDGKEVKATVPFWVKHVKRAHTRIVDFDASKSKVKKWTYFSLSGRLQIHGRYGWTGYSNQDVDLYFRAKGSHHWKYVTSTETRWHGKFWAKVKASKSGTWRAVFDGNRYAYGSSSSGEYVYVPHWGYECHGLVCRAS